MRNKKLDALVLQLENYAECWKQFSRYLNAARARQFDQNDETQFLELKSLITQELELIFAAIDCVAPKKPMSIHSSAMRRRFAISANSAKARCVVWKISGTKFTSPGSATSASSKCSSVSLNPNRCFPLCSLAASERTTARHSIIFLEAGTTACWRREVFPVR